MSKSGHEGWFVVCCCTKNAIKLAMAGTQYNGYVSPIVGILIQSIHVSKNIATRSAKPKK